jgi:hypothetical protein
VNRIWGCLLLGLSLVVGPTLACLADVVFTPYPIDTAVDGAAGVYACDIDGDGDNDVLGAAANSNQIAWWRNDGGDPLAWTKFLIADSFGGAIFVYGADVDGDLRMDVIAAGYNRDQVAWWRNNGGDPITWTKQILANGFTQAHEVYACDLDRDGDTDVLAAGAGNNTIAWWRNDGGDPIAWTYQVLSSTFAGARSVRAADLDGDLDIDVVGAALVDNQLTWWRNEGGSPIVWTEITIDAAFGGAHMVRTCDMDLDGDADLAAAAYTLDQIAWWRNDGGNPMVWTKQIIVSGIDGPVTVCPSDLDGDGDVDVLGAAQNASDIAWWSNDGGAPPVWTLHMLDDDFGGAWPAYAADLNGDTKTDILAGGFSADEIRWWKNDALAGVMTPGGTDQAIGNRLYQNSPNPFGPATAIRFDLAHASQVWLAVYDVRGRLVKTLIDGSGHAGANQIEWDGSDSRGAALPSGLYFSRILTEDFQATRPLILVR